MTLRRTKLLLRRLRPATIRTRLALLAAAITLVPLTATAIPFAFTERTSLVQSVARKTQFAAADAHERLRTVTDLSIPPFRGDLPMQPAPR